MAEQTSRLAIILDSLGAQKSSESLASALGRLTQQGERASDSTDNLSVSFKRLATSAAGALSIGVVIKTVDEWGQVAARIKNALKSVEGDIKNYSMLQERFLEISNRNGKNIADTQLLYIGAASSMQELGYSTNQTVDYIESLSSSMTANASSVNEVMSMQNALNKSMVAGKVAGENWNSIMNATPTLLGDIAKQLEKQNGGIKVTEMEVKKLAADGKISFKLFADAVMAAKDANNALADSMDNTVADGITRVTNSAKAYYGELNQSLGATRAMSAALATISNNFGEVSTVLTSIVGIGVARYFGNLSTSMYKSGEQSVKNALNARREAIETVRVSQAIIGKTQAERASLIAQQQSLAAQMRLAASTSQMVVLKNQMAANSARVTLLLQAETAATTSLSAAQKTLNVTGNILRGALGMVGGPAGAAMIAAGSIYYLYQNMQQAREEAVKLAGGLDGLIYKLKEMTREQKELEKAKLLGALGGLAQVVGLAGQEVRKARDEVAEKREELEALTEGTDRYIVKEKQLANAEVELAQRIGELEKANNDYINTKRAAQTVEDSLNGKLLQGADLLTAHKNILPNVSDAWKSFGFDVGSAANALGRFNAESLLVKFSTPETANMFKDLDRQLELSNKSAKDRAIISARFAAKDAGASPDEIKRAENMAAQIYDQAEAQKELTKSRNATYSESASQKMLSSLKEQQMVLIQQSTTNEKLGSQAQALVKWQQEIKDIEEKKAKGKMTAEQQSLLASKALITAELERNVQLEQAIKNREAEVKIAAYNKQLMEETAQAQKAYNMELQGAGMGNLARSRMQERLRVEDEFQKKQATLTAQYNDASSGITKEMYDKETQIIKGELDKRVLMMQGYHAEQDALRENWQLGIQESLLNYIDEASNYNQIAADAVTNILNTTTSAISTGFTDMINGTKSVGDAFSDMASGMGQAVIQQLTQMAAQWLVYQAVQLMVSKTTQSGAAAGLSANAQAASQMAGINAYASTAAIPILGPAMAPAAMAMALAATQPLALSVSALAAGGLTGMAHSGIDKVPQTGTWLLEKGERVMTENTSARLDKMLESLSKSMTPDQYAMKNIHPANQTTNNSNEENSTKVITIHAAPITIQGNPDDKTIALIEQSQKKAIMDCYKAISNDIAEGKGNVSKALGTGWNTKRKTG
ncbi:tape measure protein [Providencia heimbachae]|uniref:tape measure protein n=1 Tax=Providencia heimbachae TaxID=333962 RepID=UPI00141A1D4D|nr:tape measure protein [Providencia heimbachae]NIH23370.1 tape measure protein [Providencia heimbachae]